LSDVGPFVDTGMDIDDLGTEGRIYLAFSTISDMAQSFGYAPPEAAKRAQRRIVELEAQVADLTAQVDALISANGALVAAGYTTVDAPLVPPAGSEDHVWEWVISAPDAQSALRRAEAAVTAEKLEPRPRPSLLSRLEGVIATTQEVPDGNATAV
jgi:hypothetical protein